MEKPFKDPEKGGCFVSRTGLGMDNDLQLPENEIGANTIPPHPLGLRPLGNQYASTKNAKDMMGIFQMLPEEVLMILLEYLNSASLRSIGSTCKALFAFARSEDLWKTLWIEWATACRSSTIVWRGSWRSTFLSLESEQEAQGVSCDSLFSDVLYRPFQCANTSLRSFTSEIPMENTIPRLRDLTFKEFADTWSERPFILMQPVQDWPVYKAWDTAKLLEKYSNVIFRAEAVNWPLKSYADYMISNTDESPLYLFDKSFVEKMGICVGRETTNAAYWSPDCFGDDLFTVLDDRRPDCRWLIIGPERSGSTFHKDPNATSAWNAVLRGSKYWIMFPGLKSPPGVYMSEDQSEVTSPLSITEWLLEFHAEARKTGGCLEGICDEGEVLHIPSGWWHLVVNLETSIAITQNFVPRSHLISVLSFLRDKPEQVSGFRSNIDDPYLEFVAGMEREHSSLLLEAIAALDLKKGGKKRKWNETVGGNQGEIFTFGFGDIEDNDSSDVEIL